MAALTGEDVVSAMSINIRNAFSKAELKAIYKNSPQQNIQKPFAFIHQLNFEHQNQMRNSANWIHLLDVRVHPEDGQTDIQSWAREVAPKLIEALNIITISGQAVKSRSIEWKVEDDVLHFIVSYAYRVIRPTSDIPDIQSLRYGRHIKK